MNTPTSTTQPPPDRFCDLVMKGGITSGVVYPAAIARLANTYRFRSIGGTSAGAIAAAATAAAEFQRRNSGSTAGFRRLADLPRELSSPAERGAGMRKLLSLFQPQEGAHRLFGVLVAALNSGGTYRRIGAVVWGLLRSYAPALVLAVVVGALAWRFSSPLAGVLLGAIVWVAGLVAWILRDLAVPIVANGYGLCNGMPGHASRHDALTPWLHALIQDCAGRKGGAPLTFGDLWAAPGGPSDSTRSIDLQMYATNLAHGRPYVFPITRESGVPHGLRSADRLYFKPQELEPYLPRDVHDWLVAHSQPYECEPERVGRDPDTAEAVALGLLELPPPERFPVLLAARMSLSFPLLFSAVPLWAIDHDVPRGQRHFRRCWFSDGGICSNFPLHLFDGLVPRWPTFGMSLEPKISGREMIYLPQTYAEGYGERWDHFDGPVPGHGARQGEQPRDGLARFGGFVGAIVGTMQNWNDNSLARMPGVRDRVARVRLEKDEGGLNLDMEKEKIDAVASRGADAAVKLMERFAPPEGATTAAGWDEHRLVRLNVLLGMLKSPAAKVLHALSDSCPHVTPIDTLIDRAEREAAAGYEKPLSPEQAAALRAMVQALREQMAALVEASAQKESNPFVAVPRPELRVRPPL